MSTNVETLKAELQNLTALLEGVREDSDFARIAKLASDLRFAINYADFSTVRENQLHGSARLESQSVLKKSDFEIIEAAAEKAGPKFVKLFKLYEDIIIEEANNRDKQGLKLALERYQFSWAELEKKSRRKH